MVTIIAIFEKEAEVHGHGQFHHPLQVFLHPFGPVPARDSESTLF
jgi:hypothetical protein